MNTVIASGDTTHDVANRFNDREWTKQGTWPGSFLWFAAILESFSETWTGRVLDPRLAIADYACLAQPHGAQDCLIGARCFDEIRAVMDAAFSQVGPAYFQDYARLCEEKCDAWLQFAESVNGQGGEIDALSDNAVAELMERYFMHLRENGAFMDTIIVLADLLGDVVGGEVDTLLNAHQVHHPAALGVFLSLNAEEPRPTNMVLAERSLGAIASEVRNSAALRELFERSPQQVLATLPAMGPGILAAVNRHVERFGWLNTYSFSGEPFTPEEVVQFVQDLLDDGLGTEEGDLPVEGSDELSERLRAIPVPSRVRDLVSATHALTYVNTAKDDVHQITWQKIMPLLRTIARRLGCGIPELTRCTPQELINAIRAGSLDHALIALREEGWAMLKSGDLLQIVQGREDIDHLYGRLKSTAPADVQSLAGRPVLPGVVRGRARIVLTVEDCAKVAPGDVLVATNTNPDFIPAMRRAGAFVTDTGNLICHAVIAAREFNKTCVIGTQVATQILRDGEWVEVDGSLGTVVRLDPSSSDSSTAGEPG